MAPGTRPSVDASRQTQVAWLVVRVEVGLAVVARRGDMGVLRAVVATIRDEHRMRCAGRADGGIGMRRDGRCGEPGGAASRPSGEVGRSSRYRRARPPRRLTAVRVDFAVATPAFLDLTFVGLETLPALGEERFAGELLRSAGGGAIIAVGASRLGVSTGRRQLPP
jgi:hypothetical protein